MDRAVRGRTPQKEVTAMNRNYEIMFIVRPDVDEAELDKLIETFSGYVTTGGGTIKQTEKMGRRRLAYTVRKFNDGFYVLLIVEAPASLISEIERRLRVSEQVIKFITVRTDEEDKRVAKIKAHRDAHVKRSALPQVNAEAAAATPNEPAAPEASAPAAVAEPETVAAE
jgi:small subunit ribosomal protein S6